MRRAFTFVELAVVVAIIGILAVVLFPAMHRTGCGARVYACQSNLKQIGLGFLQYVSDYDEKFPPAKTNSKTTWATSIRPYLRSWQVFDCPSATPLPPQKVYLKPLPDRTTDYFYNRRLASFGRITLAAPVSTILGGDGLHNALLGSSISQLSVNWKESQSSPSRRHPYPKGLADRLLNRNFSRANYLLTDGRVKSLTPDKITLQSPKKSDVYTFLTR